MNTNSNLTGVGGVGGVGGVCNVTVPSAKKDLNAFVTKYETEIMMGFVCFLNFVLVAAGAYKINQLETIAQGIYIDANYDKMLMGQLNTRDYKIMKSINLNPDNITEQRKDFQERFR
jgi:hypothetical protein